MVEAMDVDEAGPVSGGARDVLYIPSQNSDLTVVLPWRDMRDAELVVDLLKAEEAPLCYWIDAARVYYNKGACRGAERAPPCRSQDLALPTFADAPASLFAFFPSRSSRVVRAQVFTIST